MGLCRNHDCGAHLGLWVAQICAGITVRYCAVGYGGGDVRQRATVRALGRSSEIKVAVADDAWARSACGRSLTRSPFATGRAVMLCLVLGASRDASSSEIIDAPDALAYKLLPIKKRGGHEVPDVTDACGSGARLRSFGLRQRLGAATSRAAAGRPRR